MQYHPWCHAKDHFTQHDHHNCTEGNENKRIWIKRSTCTEKAASRAPATPKTDSDSRIENGRSWVSFLLCKVWGWRGNHIMQTNVINYGIRPSLYIRTTRSDRFPPLCVLSWHDAPHRPPGCSKEMKYFTTNLQLSTTMTTPNWIWTPTQLNLNSNFRFPSNFIRALHRRGGSG